MKNDIDAAPHEGRTDHETNTMEAGRDVAGSDATSSTFWIVTAESLENAAHRPFACRASSPEEALGMMRAEAGPRSYCKAKARAVERDEAIQAILLEILLLPERNGWGPMLPIAEDGSCPMRERIRGLLVDIGGAEDEEGHRQAADGWRPGERAWFQTSEGEPFWDRSQSPVTITGIQVVGEGQTFAERQERALHHENSISVYHVLFDDGLEGAVFEDELLTSPRFFDERWAPSHPLQQPVRRRQGKARYWAPKGPYVAGSDGLIVDANGWPIAQVARNVWPGMVEAMLTRAIAEMGNQ